MTTDSLKEASTSETPGLVRCPGCELALPAGNPRAEIAHLQERRPEIIAGRLREADL